MAEALALADRENSLLRSHASNCVGLFCGIDDVNRQADRQTTIRENPGQWRRAALENVRLWWGYVWIKQESFCSNHTRASRTFARINSMM